MEGRAILPARAQWVTTMELPKIDIASLPGLETATGLFGSLSAGSGPSVDDRIVVIMVYLYELVPPEALV